MFIQCLHIAFTCFSWVRIISKQSWGQSMPYQCSANAAISLCHLNAKIELHPTCQTSFILFPWLESVQLYWVLGNKTIQTFFWKLSAMPRKFAGVPGKLCTMLQTEGCHLSALLPPRRRTLQEIAILYSHISQNGYKKSVIPNYSHIVPFLFHLFFRPFDLPLLQEILQSTSSCSWQIYY